jgi:superfamily II DNA or RNA helicase
MIIIDAPPFSPELAPLYTRVDLTRWLGHDEIAKGEAYLDAFKEFDLGPGWVAGRVQGSRSRLYQVYGACKNGVKGPKFEGECTCPVGYRCKHIAAAFLRWLRWAEEARANASIGGPSRAVLSWLETLSQRTNGTALRQKKAAKPAQAQRLIYCVAAREGGLGITIWKARQTADQWQGGETWSNVERALKSPPKFVTEEDLPALLLLYQQGKSSTWSWYEFFLDGTHAARFLELALATDRLLPHDIGTGSRHTPISPSGPPCRLGEPRTARLVWRPWESSALKPELRFDPEARILLLTPLWYADPAHGTIGLGRLAGAEAEQGNPAWLDTLLHAPPLTPKDAPLVAEVLRERGLADYAPPTDTEARLKVVDLTPQPRLRLVTAHHRRYVSYPPYYSDFLDYAKLGFIYGGHALEPGDQDQFISEADGTILHVKRHPEAEQSAHDTLNKLGFRPTREAHLLPGEKPGGVYLTLAKDGDWAAFMEERAPRLRKEGWLIEPDHSFRHYLAEIDAWHGALEEEEEGWFSLNMGIDVAGRRLSLQPLLHELFARDRRWLAPGGLDHISDKERITLVAPEIGRIGVSATRLKPIVRTLIDLFDGAEDEQLKVSRWDAARLDELAHLADKDRWQFKGTEAVRRLAERLTVDRMVKVEPPAGFQAELRPYQRDGLSWLQYLRAQDLSGVLADDMGLGKTPQTIAHLLAEKEAGRLDAPALVVLPTSLLHNWNAELARFAPTLGVLTLHGLARKEAFASIPEHDVVLTTYPLLWRDADELKRHRYHLLILDEAQSVKNASSKASTVVRALDARHRLALTGTPLENHLGELWSLFDYLLPGFLGDNKDFTRRWRTPIEKHGDRIRAELLARRIRPFILRRRKEDVAKELPPKTVIVRSVELEAAQRDLYETVRVAMDEKVRQEIASKGFKRSQIVILDALLKLRQACCDPGLVKLQAASKVKQSAKLELLCEMLPELIAEDRRILLFSQFTSMLEIIEARLAKLKIPYLKLTGDTKDRATPVKKFQAGEVPLFLISLKAGGVGLNLTAADTVIHYDPWWNPAVENQATDRAHRIGQDKNVFVYKLVVAGSIEEKIMALQEKKAALAAGILSEDGGELAKFNESDIAALLEPLPD